MHRASASCLLAWALVVGCGDADSTRAGGGASSSSGGATGGASSGAGGSSTSSSSGAGGAAPFDPDAPAHLATDVTIERIWALQTVAIPLSDAGAALAHDTPIVAGRDLWLRFFLAPLPAPRAVELELVLEPDGGAPTAIHLAWDAGAAGVEGTLGTTPLLMIPAAEVQPGLRYSVRVLDPAAPLAGPGGTLASRFPLDGSRTALGAAPVHALSVTIVPLRWDADGSGRLPDTSPAALAAMSSLLLARYPVNDVVLTVHPIVPYAHGLKLSGSVDFNDVNDLLYNLRASEAPATDVYYYGLVTPAASFNDYCTGTCVTGQSYTVTDPTSADLRLGAGVAFDAADAAATMAHELGHMLGRYHSPCGVSSWDVDYPYPGGLIGVWGWDPRSAALEDPAVATDLMGYCDPQWISDYTYRALSGRMLAVGITPGTPSLPGPAPAKGPPPHVRVLHVGGGGEVSLGRSVLATGAGGAVAEVRWLDAAGRALAVVPARAARSGHDGEYSLFAAEVPMGARAELVAPPRW